mmetsp:Transcript_10547/g.27687  ORF Transcript_10547/g.27687 Transcript_10547/m.27687 type:complete len:140 (+) Transcript_10547:534-953(+)
MSDRSCAMRSVCLDQGSARYFTFSRPNVIWKCVAWIPDSNLNDHAKDESIVDTCHLDLVKLKNGKSLLTAENFKSAVHPGTTCLFVHSLKGERSDTALVEVRFVLKNCSAFRLPSRSFRVMCSRRWPLAEIFAASCSMS